MSDRNHRSGASGQTGLTPHAAIVEGTSEIQQLVISRAISGMRIE